MNFESLIVLVILFVSVWAITVVGSRNADGSWRFKNPLQPWRG